MTPWGYIKGSWWPWEVPLPCQAELVVEKWGRGGWPSIAATSSSVHVVPERVKVEMEKISASDMHFCPVKMDELQKWKPENYRLENLYALLPKAKIPLDERLLGADYIAGRGASIMERMVPATAVTDPPRFARVANKASAILICTFDLVALARRHKWKEFEFVPLDFVEDPMRPIAQLPFSIDHMTKQWPPKWYPDGFEPHPSNVIDRCPPDPLKAL